MYKKGSNGWVKHWDFMLLDVICLHISFIAAYFIRHGIANPYANIVYRNMAVVLTLMEIIIVIFFESFKKVLKRGYYKEFIATAKHTVLILFFATFYLFTIQSGAEYSRTSLYLMAIIYSIMTYVVRCLWKYHLIQKMSMGGKRSLLIITAGDLVNTVVGNIKNHNYEMFYISGMVVLDKDLRGSVVSGVPVVANRDDLVEYVCREWIDEVFVNLPESEPYPEKMMNQFTEMGVVVHMRLAKSSKLVGARQFIERLGDYTVLTTSINYASTRQVLAKRMLDITGSLVGCILMGILYLILAPIIYIQSPGPIFFKQTRIGKNGKPFKIYKFRSMYVDAEERKKELMEKNRMKDGMMFKLDWDPRIIGSKKMADGRIKKGVGNFIRDWSLDEFPQFINVLKGDMSLVGTRPPTMDEWEKYELHHRARLAVKPGITGLWQVSGRSNITDFEEVVKLDKKYIVEWSMGLDIKILLKTIGVVFRKDGAM